MSRTFKHLVTLFALLCLCAQVCADDFSTDPDLAADWTQYVFYSGDLVTTTWNSADGDLDLTRPAGQSGIGLYRTVDTRSATDTDPVTLTVKELSRTDGTWGFVGLMISAVAQPGYTTTEDDTYTLRMFPTGPTTFNFQVTRTYRDGTGDYILYQSADETFSGPYVLDIERDGDDYVFKANGTVLYTTGSAAGDLYDTAARDSMVYYQIVMAGDGAMTATVDDFGIAARELASAPNPADGQTDVLRDSDLSWTSGMFAAAHDLYVGESFEDVNTATVPTAPGLNVNSLDLARLDFGKTIYWRVDEVNGTPDKTVFKGNVWSFEVEPYSISIPGSTIAVTASSSSSEFSTPDKTVDGSGLDANDMHAIAPETMWFTAAVDLDPWIQYEFDNVMKLDVMTVWNSNGAAEVAIGWGVKDVEIAYSVDGETWDVLADANQLSRAPGLPTYNQPDEIAFNGVAAKVVRLNIQSNWGGVLMSYGLSEVQFSTIPVRARTPEPASESVDILPDSVTSWRAGRDVDHHRIYVDTDANAVADGTAASVTSNTNSLDMTSLDLELGQTYSWRVDEVNEAEAVTAWAGPLWSFSTADALVVDDFEGYGNESPDRPFQTWLDGIGYSADEFFPVAYEGNGTGAAIGHDIWSLSSPHYNGTIMETAIVSGGSQSMPFYYSNTGGAASETQRTFDGPQDWTVSGIKSLSIMFYGDPNNTGQLYVEINDSRVTYDGDAADITRPEWKAWMMDLSDVGGDLQNVTSLTIGVDGASASGMLYIDEIGLSPTLPTSQAVVLYDDFATDPSLATDWTEYAYYASDLVTPTWNSTDEDLDLVKTNGGGSVGLYRSGVYRSATDPVTLTVKALDRTSGGWGFLGLMISAVAQYGYVADTDNSYTLAMASTGGTNVRYEVRRTYQDGTGDFQMYVGEEFDLATHGPVTLDIVRVGDDYEFLADGVLLYTTAVPAAGDFYGTTAKDSLVYTQIMLVGDGAMTATVDDFGIPQG